MTRSLTGGASNKGSIFWLVLMVGVIGMISAVEGGITDNFLGGLPERFPVIAVAGYGSEGQLGTGSAEDSSLPVPVQLSTEVFGEEPRRFVDGSSLGPRTVLIDDVGIAYVVGSNLNGALGLGDREERDEFVRLDHLLSGENATVLTHVVAGPEVTVFLNNEGLLLSAGTGGEHVIADLEYAVQDKLWAARAPPFATPLVDFDCGDTVCGGYKEDGSFYSWGIGVLLGEGAGASSRYTPDLVHEPTPTNPHRVRGLIAFRYGMFFITDEQEIWSHGVVNTCPTSPLGHVPTVVDAPTKIASFVDNGTKAVQVAAGDCHMHVLDTTGKLWSMGGPSENLGTGVDGGDGSSFPVEVTFFTDLLAEDDSNAIRAVTAGPTTSFVVTESGIVYAWGTQGDAAGGAKQLGLGFGSDEPSVSTPTKVSVFVDGELGDTAIAAVYPGRYHTVFVEDVPDAFPGVGYVMYIAFGSILFLACAAAILTKNSDGEALGRNNFAKSVYQTFAGGDDWWGADDPSIGGGANMSMSVEEPGYGGNDFGGEALSPRADPYAAKTMVGGAGDVYTQQPRKPSGGSKRAAPGGSRKGSKGSKGSRGSRRGSKGSRRKGPGSDASPADFLPSTIDYKKVEKMAGMHKSYKVGKNLS